MTDKAIINFSTELHDFPLKNGYWIRVSIRDKGIKDMRGIYVTDDFVIYPDDNTAEPISTLADYYDVTYIFLGKDFPKIEGLPMRKNPNPAAECDDDF